MAELLQKPLDVHARQPAQRVEAQRGVFDQRRAAARRESEPEAAEPVSARSELGGACRARHRRAGRTRCALPRGALSRPRPPQARPAACDSETLRLRRLGAAAQADPRAAAARPYLQLGQVQADGVKHEPSRVLGAKDGVHLRAACTLSSTPPAPIARAAPTQQCTRGCCAAAPRLGKLLGVASHESDAQRSSGGSRRHGSAPRTAQARSTDTCRQQRRGEEHARARCAVVGRWAGRPAKGRRQGLVAAPLPFGAAACGRGRRCIHASLSVPHSRSAAAAAFPLCLEARSMALHTRYTRRRSPDTLALLITAVLACLLCQAGWSAAFGDGLPQLDVGPRRRLLREFTPLQKVRRGAAPAAAPPCAARGGAGGGARAAGGRFSRPCIPVAPSSGHLFASPRGAGPRRRVRPALQACTARAALGSWRSARSAAPLRPFPRRSVCAVP